MLMTFATCVLPSFCVGLATGMVLLLTFTRKLAITVVTERPPQQQQQPQKQQHPQHNHQQPNKPQFNDSRVQRAS